MRESRGTLEQSYILIESSMYLMSTGESQNEKVLGTIIYAATSSGWVIQHVIFTDNRVVVIPFSSLNDGSEKAGDIGAIGLMLGGADMGSINYGLSVEGISDLAQRNAWNKLKKKVAGKQTVSCEEGKLPQDLLKKAIITIPYEKIKEVSIKKNWGANDFKLNLKESLILTHSWLLASSADEVKALIEKTPLAPKLKQI
jgi:hypothetical protein